MKTASMSHRTAWLATLAALGLAASACGGGGTEEVARPTVDVTGDVQVRVGETLTLNATTNDGTDSAYSWGSSDENVATVADGVVTGVAAGTAIITATGADTGASDTWGVVVFEDVPPPDPNPVITITGGASVAVGETLTLSASTAFGEDSGYAWESSDDTVATIDDTGVVTGVAAGEVVITATGADTEASGTWGVAVFETTPLVTVTGDVSVLVGETLTLTATTTGGDDASYTWESTDDTIASVDATGVVTGVAAGEAVITATGDDTGASGSWGVSVADPPPTMVTVTGDMAVQVGATLQLTAATTNGTDASYTWESSDDTIATVDATGLVMGAAVGEVVITATGDDTGVQGAKGVVVTPEDFGIPFEELWEGSAHADETAEAFTHWDEDGEISTSCAKCHSTPGFQDFLGVDGTAAGVVDNPAPIGTVITCVACHNAATIELDSVTFPSGLEVTGLGSEARCMQCHQGRESTTSVNDAIAAAAAADDDTVDDELSFKNIHYFAAGATLYGGFAQGGYQYDGMAYDANNRHVAEYDTCTECHNPHTLEVDLDGCAECHTSVVTLDDLKDVRMAGSAFDYDGDGDMNEGVYYEIEGLRDDLYGAIQAYATDTIGTSILYSSAAYPYWFIDTNGNGVEDDGEVGYANRYQTWTARLVRATFNFQFSKKDPGAFAHNPKYVIQLLYDAIEDLNTVATTPVDLTDAARIDAGHFAGSEEAWRHWDEDGAVSASCSRCHSAEGLPLYVATGGSIEQPVSNGMTCATCHPADGDFTIQLTVNEVEFPSGKIVDSGDNTANLCMTCHQGRESTTSVNEAIAGLDVDTVDPSLGFKNIHYFPAGATLFGTEAEGGYQYAGMMYDGRFPHVEAFGDCEDCHSVHSQQVKVDTCAACHTGVTDLATAQGIRMPGSISDYDGDGNTAEGIYQEIVGLRDLLYAAIQSYASTVAGTAIIYESHAYPYFFIDTNGNGSVDAGEAIYPNKYASWTPRLLKAAFNYQYSMKDPGAFAHNAKYVIQFLHDSLADLGEDVSGLARVDGDHFDSTAEAWRHWDEDGEVSTSCARCHTPTGFSEFLETGAVAEAQPVSYGMTCEACHTGTDFAGAAPLKTVADVTFPGGTTITNTSDDPSFLCLQCHQGRKGKASIDDEIAAGGSLSFQNIHYLSAGGTLYGSDANVGYEYDTKTYAAKWNHYGGTTSQCSYCHEVTGNRHAFKPQLKSECLGCHSEATAVDITSIRKNRTTDYDGDGDNSEPLVDEINALAALLYAEMQAVATAAMAPIVYEGHTYPYFFNDLNGDGITDPDEANYGNQYASWTGALLKAAHNYQMSQKEPGAWAHNTDYVVQLLIDSIEDLGGDITGLNRP